MLTHERQLSAAGFSWIAGIDEVGRGPLAGPVVAAAVILPWRRPIRGVRDSKEVPATERERLYHQILESALAVGVGMVGPREIERINILQATIVAMEEAVSRLGIVPDALLIDAVTLRRLDTPQRAIIHGDAVSYLIAAASIVAKVIRDRLMEDYHVRYPRYGFSGHKGYGTPFHVERLSRHGSCPIHRRTFRGVTPTATNRVS
ncbi:MAG: ribonuclease HII [Nitrospiria bacterium]